MQFYQVGVTHAAGEDSEAMERPAMDITGEGMHCNRIIMAFQKGVVIA